MQMLRTLHNSSKLYYRAWAQFINIYSDSWIELFLQILPRGKFQSIENITYKKNYKRCEGRDKLQGQHVVVQKNA